MTAATSWDWYMTVSTGSTICMSPASVGIQCELVALQVLAGDDRGDARDLERLGRVDRLDGRVGVRAADDVQPELAGQVHVLDVLALALDEARVFLALDRVAHAPDLGAGAKVAVGFGRHVVSPAQPAAAGSAETACPSTVSAATTGADAASRSVPAACWIALTMFT